jgi:small subunit ribosomal protein S18
MFRKAQAREELKKEAENSREFLKMMPRAWQHGDVYAPHDLSPSEAFKFKKKQTPKRDIFDELGINPLDEWRVRIAH